jgi:hypothetical protein
MDILRKSVFLSALALSVAVSTGAQENRFLYLQTDDGQPFYVKTGNVHHSSTLSGFLILSRLQDTAIDFVLGFPRDMYPAQRFRVSPVDRDRGLVLKRREDGRWVLFDLQNMEATPGEEVSREAPVSRQALPAATTDSFTTMLSTAIGDSSLLETKVTGGRNDEGATGTKAASVAGVDSTKAIQELPSPAVGSVLPSVAAKSATDSAISADSVKSDTSAEPVQRPTSLVDSVRYTAPAAVPKVSPAAAEQPTSRISSGVSRPDRTDCKSSQTVKQLGDLRRRMESIKDEEARVAEAVRELRLRCFTTEQVRSLLVVFDREEGRFKLLSAAYPHVQDPSAYPGLLPVLKDPYFIHRFKRLTGMPVD